MKRKASFVLPVSLLVLSLAAATMSQTKGALAASAHLFQPNVNDMMYYGGPIMTGTVNVYAIYWFPTGSTVDPQYISLLDSYYRNVGGHRLYNIIEEYPDGNGNPPTNATFAGSWVDTQAYPLCQPNCQGKKLSPTQILDEVQHAINVNNWPNGGYNYYFPVYLASGEGSTVGCGYHSYGSGNRTIIYSQVEYPDSYSGCSYLPPISPNNDPVADAAITISAHEQLEAATDPIATPDMGGTGWHTNISGGGEVGDLCVSSDPQLMYGPLNYDNGLANQDWIDQNGNPNYYIIQMMWDNKTSSCIQG